MSQPDCCRKRCTHAVCAAEQTRAHKQFQFENRMNVERMAEVEWANDERKTWSHIYIQTHTHAHTNFKSSLNILEVLTLNSLRYRHFILFLLLVLLAVLPLRMWENFENCICIRMSCRNGDEYVHDTTGDGGCGGVGPAVTMPKRKFSQMINNLTSPFNILHNYTATLCKSSLWAWSKWKWSPSMTSKFLTLSPTRSHPPACSLPFLHHGTHTHSPSYVYLVLLKTKYIHYYECFLFSIHITTAANKKSVEET